MAGQPSKGNPDPSRWLASGGADTAAGGPDGRAGLRGSAGAGGWRDVAGGAARVGDSRDRNSAGRGHSSGIGRTLRGMRRSDRTAVSELQRPAPPCVFAGGTGQRLLLRGRLEPACFW